MKLTGNIQVSPYWKCQLTGWSMAALYWQINASMGIDFKYGLALFYFITDIVSYIFITHLYRNIALSKGWHQLSLNAMAKLILIAVIILGLAFLVVTASKIYLLRIWYDPLYQETFKHFLHENWLGIFMAGIRLMSIWLLAYHLYHYAQREILIAKENAKLEVISKQAQLNNLSAQLNPHFFFNSLNNIKSLIIENPSAARRAVDLLADLLRSGLYKKETMLIPLKEELTTVKDYLELEKLRFEERLQQSIEVDEQLHDTLVLRLSIQTLVENAIKHGIDKRQQGGCVKIAVSRIGEFIEIRVENPGKLEESKSIQGLGLKNLQERMKLHFKGNGKFCISAQNETVLSTLLIPAHEKNSCRYS